MLTETRTLGIAPYCKECGQVNKYQHELCGKCGTSLEQITTEQSNVTDTKPPEQIEVEQSNVNDTKSPEVSADSNNWLTCRVCGQPLELFGEGGDLVGS